jgi:hypothetical protein
MKERICLNFLKGFPYRRKYIVFLVDFPFNDEKDIVDKESTEIVGGIIRKMEKHVYRHSSYTTFRKRKKRNRVENSPSLIDMTKEMNESVYYTDSANSNLTTKEVPGVGWKDQFCKSSVYKWSSSQIRAWMNRYVNYNEFYYRFTGKLIKVLFWKINRKIYFVEPGVFQSLREFTLEEESLFISRYFEFKEHHWHVGSAWGLFSLALPHRVGYQCSNFYRKLLKEGKLHDPSYGWDEYGHFHQIYKDPEALNESCVKEVRRIQYC